ncbi:MAG: CsbD family protein [Bryobacteraceae bacterium]|nr:CsbD family protein [Bryobacteraceae bacterium]
MNWEQLEGKWHQFAGSAKERWGKLTDDDWKEVAGKREQLVGRIQERYGIAKEDAEAQAEEWSKRFRESQERVLK